jgi:hypothetical protein
MDFWERVAKLAFVSCTGIHSGILFPVLRGAEGGCRRR